MAKGYQQDLSDSGHCTDRSYFLIPNYDMGVCERRRIYHAIHRYRDTINSGSTSNSPLINQFDGCSPKMLFERADVENGKIVFQGATSYEILVLRNFEIMTP